MLGRAFWTHSPRAGVSASKADYSHSRSELDFGVRGGVGPALPGRCWERRWDMVEKAGVSQSSRENPLHVDD